HENSKLFPQMLEELTLVRLNAEEFRREFLRRRRPAVQSGGALTLALEPCWRELLTAIAQSIDLQLFYAVELRVVADEMLAVYEPPSEVLEVIKRLSFGERSLLREALRLMTAPDEAPHNGPLLFILGCFSRNEVLLGRRGYRRTLLEAGRVTQEI